MIVDVYMEMIITFWNVGLTANRLLTDKYNGIIREDFFLYLGGSLKLWIKEKVQIIFV